MIELLIALMPVNSDQPKDCINIKGTMYCAIEEVNNKPVLVKPSSSLPPVPIHQVDPNKITDSRYADVVFTYSTIKGQNDCVESLLFLLEGSSGSNHSCALMVQGLFGAEFASNSQVAENIFRLMAKYQRSINKLEFVLPLGLDRRMKAHTGLTTFVD